MPIPIPRTSLDRIVGFSGKTLGDQLRYHQLLHQVPDDEKPTEPALKPLPRPVEPISTDSSLLDSSVVPKPLPRFQPPPITQIDQAQANLSDTQNQPLTWKGKNGEVLYAPPSDKKHRLLAGLKTGGRYALEALAHGGNPFAAIGAGIYGIGKGAADPETPAKLRWQDRVDKAQGIYNRQLGNAENQSQLEARQAQTDALQRKPDEDQKRQDELERDNLRGTYQAILSSGQNFDPEANVDHKAIYDRAKGLGLILPAGQRQRQAKEPIFKERTNADGSKTSLKSTDNGETWNEVSALGSAAPLRERGTETPQQYRSRVGQFRASKKLLDDFSNQEASAAKKKDEAFARASSLENWYKSGAKNERGEDVTEEDVKAARKTADEAQRIYEGFAEKKTKALADMTQYGDVDEQGSPREPRQATPSVRGTGGLTIEGAIEHFNKVNKRLPNKQEIANMKAALGQ